MMKNVPRIAIVDDSRAFCSGLIQLLNAQGWEGTAYHSAQAALAAFSGTDPVPDVLVTDIELSGLEGMEFLRQVRKLERIQETPILLLTSREDSRTMCDAIDAGADAFAQKARIRETFAAHVKSLLRLRQGYQAMIAARQLGAIKGLIGTYKHEFGNSIAAIDGKIRKLERLQPDLAKNEDLQSIKKWTARLVDTLEKLNQLRKYEEEEYVKGISILKTG